MDANTANLEELCSISGIGPEIASAIIARREQQPFRSLEELVEISGISPENLERFAEQGLTVEPVSSATTSTASNEEVLRVLQGLLGGGAGTAEAIAAAMEAARAAAGPGTGTPPTPQPQYPPTFGRPSELGAIAAAEGAKAVAIKQVLDLGLLAGADCSGARCAFSCSVGCLVGCGVFGGTTVAFGALGGTAGGAGTTIAITPAGPDITTIQQMPLGQYIAGGGLGH